MLCCDACQCNTRAYGEDVSVCLDKNVVSRVSDQRGVGVRAVVRK
jgi:hypothetical protein